MLKVIFGIFFTSIAFAKTYKVVGTQYTLGSTRTHAKVRESFFEEFAKASNAIFSTVYYNDEFTSGQIEAVKRFDPDVAIFPYEFLQETFLPVMRADAISCGVFFTSSPEEVAAKTRGLENFIPIVASVDVRNMVLSLEATMGIRKLLVIGGPFDEAKKLGNSVIRESPFHAEFFSSKNWEDWQSKILKEIKNFDAFVILPPYGVTYRNGERLDVKKSGDWLVDNISIPTVGMLSNPKDFPRLLNFPVSPHNIGECAATLVREKLELGKSKSDCGSYLRPWRTVVVHRRLKDRFDLSKLNNKFFVEVSEEKNEERN